MDTDRRLEAEDLAATGSIDGVPVRCMTASMQLTCHQGYDLPPAHAADVGLLNQLIALQSDEEPLELGGPCIRLLTGH